MALIVFFEPTITLRLKPVVAVVPLNTRSNTVVVGLDLNRSSTVRGLSIKLFVLDNPKESVTVSRSSRCDGYS